LNSPKEYGLALVESILNKNTEDNPNKMRILKIDLFIIGQDIDLESLALVVPM